MCCLVGKKKKKKASFDPDILLAGALGEEEQAIESREPDASGLTPIQPGDFLQGLTTGLSDNLLNCPSAHSPPDLVSLCKPPYAFHCPALKFSGGISTAHDFAARKHFLCGCRVEEQGY